MKNYTAKEFFRDYWDNYLSVAKIAEGYGITENHAHKLIEKGQEDLNRDAAIRGRAFPGIEPATQKVRPR